MNLTIHLLKTNIDEESNCVQIRWRISCLTNKSLGGILKVFFYQKYIDGLSTFYVRGDGRIYKHRVDRVH
ncbi:unnamed protein product [Rotaria sp. Silwood1]|nr:unnamed protein product [Rotaria sp. Silwood1]CAF3379343.1 unnamed protein product [Rotaria sp. Silwood1]CAF4682693.1 unnamed protein product [Rotaria sp. Silwood1]